MNAINRLSSFSEFAAGARDTIPMMIGAAPFGVIFGTLCSAGPLSPWHGQLMSLVVFAGVGAVHCGRTDCGKRQPGGDLGYNYRRQFAPSAL